MRPFGALHEILIVYSEANKAYTHAAAVHIKSRKNPLQVGMLESGLLRYLLHFNQDGSLSHWERYTYMCMMGATRATVESKFHRIEILDGTYSAQFAEAIARGIKVEEPVDTLTPEHV